ncbi:hypothetical protein [Streptomyces sp. WZ-12]|uniref:hypothetical protein n=1 Tax=Streptomyces sp. WZ-12 TaxID=3030210 RepID=UPI0023816519|nr:hypothetical protein [Streptomyces sp. WZ-12]
MLDALVIGAGPGGLQTALTLGRSRRSVLLLDGGPGRNEPAHEVHNFLSREGTSTSGPPLDRGALFAAVAIDTELVYGKLPWE